MKILGFMLEHVGHILGFKSASKSIPELDIHHGDPMGANWGFRTANGTSGGPPGKRECRSLRGWDEDFGGPYMSFGKRIVSHSLVAP